MESNKTRTELLIKEKNVLLNKCNSLNQIIKTDFGNSEFGVYRHEEDDIEHDNEIDLAYEIVISLLETITEIDRYCESIRDEIEQRLSLDQVSELCLLSYSLSTESTWLKILYNNIIISNNFTQFDTFYVKNKHA
jgi:hypothetical protein